MKIEQRKNKQLSGFTMIELMIAILTIAVLSTIVTYQYIDMRNEARKSVLRENLNSMRLGIKNQRQQMILRCHKTNESWPSLASVSGNYLSFTDCAESIRIPDRQFIDETNLPVNPMATTGTNSVTQCVGNGCLDQCNANGCNDSGHTSGWCYNASTGEFWADSQDYDGGPELECAL